MRAIRLALATIGIAAGLYGVIGALTGGGNLVGHAAFLAAVLIAHDLVLVPIAIGVGVLVVRFVPRWALGPVQAALFASAVVTAVALPFVVGAGRTADNPSRQPLNYNRGLLIVLAVVWLAAAAAALRIHLTARRPTQPASRDDVDGP